MQVRDSYDLVVIGDQLSGLFLAAGAAQMGKKVLVLEESSVPTVSYEVPSGRFLGDFSAEPFIGLAEGTATDTFLRSLGLYQQLGDLFPRHEPPLQLVGKGYRVDFSYDPAALAPELAREFPGHGSQWQRLLGGLVTQNGSFADAAREAGLPVEAERFGPMQAALYGSLFSGDLSYLAYKEVIALAARSVRFPLGGRSALKEHLIARITAFGGSLKRSTRVEEIVFERGRLAGVLLSSYEGFVRSRFVVGAMGAKTFFHLVPKEFRPARLAEAVARIEPRHWRLNFNLLIPETSLPEGLGSHLVFEDGDFLQVQVFPKEVYGGIPPGHKALVGRVLVPWKAASLSEASVKRSLKKALGQLGKVIPFLADAPYVVSPNLEALSADSVFPRFFHYPSVDHIPPLFLAFEAGLSPAVDQREFLDWSRMGLPGLALCSRDIYPLFGSTGEIFAAMDLLALIGKSAERK